MPSVPAPERPREYTRRGCRRKAIRPAILHTTGEYQIEAAIEECHRAITVDPDFGNPWNDLGAYLLALDRPHDSIAYLERALSCPRYLTYHYAHYNLGRAYEKLGDRARAREKCLEALAEDANYMLAKDALQRLCGEQN